MRDWVGHCYQPLNRVRDTFNTCSLNPTADTSLQHVNPCKLQWRKSGRKEEFNMYSTILVLLERRETSKQFPKELDKYGLFGVNELISCATAKGGK